MPTDEVISCPACRHLLRVPADWLGTQVQCPECKAMFRAPVRGPDGALTPAELLSSPPSTAETPDLRRRSDWLLYIPAFGLMLCGIVGFLVDTYQLVTFLQHPGLITATIETGAKLTGGKIPEDAEERTKFMAQVSTAILVLTGACVLISVLVFVGGLGIALRRGYILALLGCALAAVNLVNLCCLPGLVFGGLGVLLLLTPEGREHFHVARR
jgi:hypothetical protein